MHIPFGGCLRKRQSKPTDEHEIEDANEPLGGLDEYPLDTLLIRSEPRAMADVMRRIDKKAIKLDPDFERDFVWDEVRQSRLIESVLMRIPLPVFYLAEANDGQLIVVDGLQRLTTFHRFYKGELALNIEKNTELHRKKFSDLKPRLQDRFEDGPLTFYLIDAKVPDRVRLDIFERVNSGVPLTRQQMRNALYNGPATAALRELALSRPFLSATGGALSSDDNKREMKDREAINRFFAHASVGWKLYGTPEVPDYDEYLGTALQQLNANPKKLESLKAAFVRSMEYNEQVFGPHAFRKSRAADSKRSALNLAMFDVFSVILSRYEPQTFTPEVAKKLRAVVGRLLATPAFLNSISYATARPENLHTRFRIGEEMIERATSAR